MKFSQSEIADALCVKPDISVSDEISNRVQFLVDYATKTPGCKGFVLGISGGQDSSLAGRLLTLAVRQMRQQGIDAAFYAVRLPYGVQADEDDAQLALRFIEADYEITVDIKPSVDSMVESLNKAFMGADLPAEISDFNKGNLKARARMIAQYAIAGDRNLLVVGTDHAAEAVTGFFTKFGDGAADVAPLYGLTKSQGAQILKELGAPSRLWEKAPTADLLDSKPGELDEDSLGVSYRDIDAFLQGETVSSAVKDNLCQRYANTMHKRTQPITPQDVWWRAQPDKKIEFFTGL